MQIHLKELALKGQAVRLVEDLNLPAAFEGRKDMISHRPIHADLQARFENGEAEVSGKLSVELEVSCSRCLTHVKQAIELPFREVFTQKLDADAEDNEDLHIVTEDKVDLEPYVVENVVVGLPYAPLCHEACQGLCPVCGVNRNQTACGCKQEKIDPRLAGLADFFNKEE